MIFILARRIQICAVSGCSLSPPNGQLIRSLRIFGTIIVGFSTNKENDKNGSIWNKSHWRIYRLVTQWGSFQNYLDTTRWYNFLKFYVHFRKFPITSELGLSPTMRVGSWATQEKSLWMSVFRNCTNVQLLTWRVQ